MEKRIELEKRRRDSSQIHELVLDNCRSTSIEGLTDEFVNLKSLSLIGVGLTSLKGFPKLAKLKKLELSDNRVSGGLQVLKDCPTLTILNLSNNKIKDMETLEPLKELSNLKSVDLYRNEVTQIEEYRDKVFNLLPGLSYLDGVDKNGKEFDSDFEDDDLKEMNGKDDDDDDDEDDEDGGGGEDEEVDEEEDGSEEESDEEVGLKDIYRDDLEKESDGGEYEEEDVVDESDEEDLEETIEGEEGKGGESSNAPENRGTKRKLEDEVEETEPQ
ncbi:acidic leucine-rich nuclear phosphoprotein 32 family member A [Folsomia candida]|uniref:Acidic leucine-rich nuclear phosphoprotein 32 family member A n=1 Tax=Folsomia candida TaxID=158441 RepID=A0A226E6I9_FOLCA|nr:acidic leucine-rich nuclear phosphoprotein 32 family member A [Folsomia candida]OXA52674.1 Acidic leucine-rich nuclear phosphoprotein 32 family member A [Folsomia candida]